MQYLDPEFNADVDRRREVVYHANLRTFDDFLAACKEVTLYPEIVLLQNFERHARFLPELVKRGAELAPRDDQRWSNMLQYACMRTNLEGVKAAMALGAVPKKAGTETDNILELTIAYGYDNQLTHDMICYIVSIYPKSLHGKYGGPLSNAICMRNEGAVRVLVELGCAIDEISMLWSVNGIGNSPNNGKSVSICRYLTAMGGRASCNCSDCSTSGPENDHTRGFRIYTETLIGIARCGAAAMVVLGLARVGGRVHGNGRDVLRLVAKEVWMSRIDAGWGMVEGLKRSKKFNVT